MFLSHFLNFNRIDTSPLVAERIKRNEAFSHHCKHTPSLLQCGKKVKSKRNNYFQLVCVKIHFEKISFLVFRDGVAVLAKSITRNVN